MWKKPKLSEDKILEKLAGVPAPDGQNDIVSAGMIAAVQIDRKDRSVVCLINVDPAQGAQLEPLRQRAEHVLRELQGVKKVSAILTAEHTHHAPGPDMGGTGMADPDTAPAPSPHDTPSGGRPRAPPPSPDIQTPKKSPAPPKPVPYVRHIIAIASGKGGVGKSTITTNLAFALSQSGLRTGILDADIYGPSQPRMTGLQGQKPEKGDQDQLIPPQTDGISVMSIGFMIEEEKAIIWRGPMVQSALTQLLYDVQWGTKDTPLDILLIDLPPGTGDAQLTLAQKVPLSGSIIVSTPQDIALLDARKAIAMFSTMKVPVLGMIENMSTHICSACGQEDHIFGHGGAEEEAKSKGIPFLGALPLDIDIRRQSDAGKPLCLSMADHAGAKIFEDIASKIKAVLFTKT